MAPTVRSFSAEFEPLTLVEQFPAVYPGLLESGAGMAAASSGGRFDILPMAVGECLRLDPTARLVRAARGRRERVSSQPSRAGGRRCGFPRRAASLPFSGGWLAVSGL